MILRHVVHAASAKPLIVSFPSEATPVSLSDLNGLRERPHLEVNVAVDHEQLLMIAASEALIRSRDWQLLQVPHFFSFWAKGATALLGVLADVEHGVAEVSPSLVLCASGKCPMGRAVLVRCR